MKRRHIFSVFTFFLFLLCAITQDALATTNVGKQRMGDRITISNTLYSIFSSNSSSPTPEDIELQDILTTNILSYHAFWRTL